MNLKNGTVTKISTLKDRSVKIEIVTREMTPQQMAELFLSVNNEVMNIDIPQDSGDIKSPSQRFRGVLYKIYETNDDMKTKYDTFTLYYNATMEKIIEAYKDRIV